MAMAVAPLTPVTLSLLTNQTDPGVLEYTPRTRGLHAELQSWLSPLLGDDTCPDQEPERKPPARLPSMDEHDVADSLLTTAWSEEAQDESVQICADPLNRSQVTAEAALESLLLTVVDESDAKFKTCTGNADLSAELEKLENECVARIKASFAQKVLPSYKDVSAMMTGYTSKVRATATAHVADLAAGYDAARLHMRTFGVEHLQAVWAEAEASRTAKAALSVRELTAKIDRVRESEDGAQEAARTARAAAGDAAKEAALLHAEIAQLTEKIRMETTRADAAESVLIKKFEQMDELSKASTGCSRRLLSKVEFLTASWKEECQKSKRLEIALRKLRGEREAEEAKRRPLGKEETPSEFSEKVKEMKQEVNEVRGRVVQIVEHQESIRKAILAIRNGVLERNKKRSAADVNQSDDLRGPGLVPSPPQRKQEPSGAGSVSKPNAGRQLSVAIPQAQAVGGSGRTVKPKPSWQGRPSVRGNGRGSWTLGGGNEIDEPGSGSAARLQHSLMASDGPAARSSGQLSSRTRQPALSLTSSRRLVG